MPRSWRHKSHKQSKNSLKESREYSDSEVEDVKVKDSGPGSILDRGLKDSGHLGLGEKRKVSLLVKEGKDLGERRNGDVVDEYVSSKMRKEEKVRDKSNGGDRRDGAEKEKKGESLKYDGEKGSKSREGKGDVKSGRSSKRYEEENGALFEEREYNRSGSRSEKRKSEKEKEGKDIKESRDKEHGFEKEKKGVESRLGNEANVDGDIWRKQEMESDVLVEDRHGKRRRNSAERNTEIDEKRPRKKKESCGDLDKYQDDIRDGEARRLSSRSERLKEGRSFDEKKKEGNYGEKSYEDVDKDVKYHDDLDRDSKHRDAKYRDDGDRDSRHRDDKYRDSGDRDGRRREDKYRQNSGRDAKHIDDKNRGEVERDSRRQDDKYREDGGRDNRPKDVKNMEEVDKESRHSDTRYYNEADRDGRHKVERFREDTNRDVRHKEDRYHDDYERENRHRDKLGVDDHRDKIFREGKYRDDRLLKDRSGDKSDSKRSRDENHASGFHSRKSSLYDGGDARISRYKDDHAEKHSSGHRRGDLTNERERSTSKIAETDLSATHYRRQSSPSSGSHIMSDQYRLPKQDEPKYKDYSVTPNREHENKHLQKDDTNSGEFSAQRRLKPDTRASPMSLMVKSPSSMSDRKNSRTDARLNLDVDESGPRYGGLKDGKDFFGTEARGSRDVAMKKFPGDEFSEVDGDKGSVFSAFARSGSIPNSAKSLLAPPPFRTGADSSLPFGTSDDDSRGKSSNRHRRLEEASMGRMQGNSWRGAPSWPSPVPNGFTPFQHGPPPVGFHHMMQQFPVPHLFGIRPSMDLNHHGLPYPIPDPDRFSGHVRPMGWRNLDDDSCPPPLHEWEANNGDFNEDSHLFGRRDWDSTRNHSGIRTSSASTEMSVSEKQNILLHGVADEYNAGQFSQQSQHVKTQHGFQADSSEDVQRETSAPSLKSKEIPTTECEPEQDDGNMCHAYLSMLDISADLAGPELYAQCANLHGVDHNLLFDGDEPKILYLEEDVDGNTASNKIRSTFLFTGTDDSVFQKAMILYNKLKEKFKTVEPDSLSPGLKTTMSLPNQSGDDMSVKDVVVQEMVEMEMGGGEQMQLDIPNICQFKEPGIIENVEAACVPAASENIDADDLVDTSDSCVYATSSTSMEVQVSSDIEARDINDSAIEENLCLETTDSPANAVESEMAISSDATMASDVPISSNEWGRGMEVKCGDSLISDVSEACEAVMPEPIESGLVNLSRIHHSPESTH
ncbi:hypothetical protein LIER_07941 [Lithospermum erythrorhizon]|uniref:Uncharacterized protein n=1 Tax=Lithospermum erythrorhizon TaxID=34254 RepID=A0AAV3PA45_LITER